jgi:hypothetical protein
MAKPDNFMKRFTKANQHNHVLLEPFSGYRNQIRVKGKCGHEWLAWPTALIEGSGCLKCFDYTLRAQVQRAREHTAKQFTSASKRITVLEPYINAKTRLLVQGACGHRWRLLPGCITRVNKRTIGAQ